jgi:hypothetical protein
MSFSVYSCSHPSIHLSRSSARAMRACAPLMRTVEIEGWGHAYPEVYIQVPTPAELAVADLERDRHLVVLVQLLVEALAHVGLHLDVVGGREGEEGARGGEELEQHRGRGASRARGRSGEVCGAWVWMFGEGWRCHGSGFWRGNGRADRAWDGWVGARPGFDFDVTMVDGFRHHQTSSKESVS